MCVIIYVPKESTISLEEIRDAWNTNPHGAGYSIQKDGKVYFKRGFMKLSNYIEEIKPLIGVYNLLLHFRISTSNKVNIVQTHPYKKGNVTLTEGFTNKPVICMNGIITGQTEYKDCNDTMSYIIDHNDAFANVNQDILNIIEDSTGAKWAVMKPEEVLLSSEFQEEEGRYYSNKNHLWKTYLTYYKTKNRRLRKSFESLIKGRKLKNSIRRDKKLHDDILDFINYWCNNDYDDSCEMCTKCLKTAKTVRDVKITLDENYYCSNVLCYDDEEDFIRDFYNYNYNYDYKTKKDKNCKCEFW